MRKIGWSDRNCDDCGEKGNLSVYETEEKKKIMKLCEGCYHVAKKVSGA